MIERVGSEKDVEIFRKYAKGELVVELGAYKGGSSAVIAENCRKLITIDLFAGEMIKGKKEEADFAVFEETKKNLEKYKNVEVRKNDVIIEAGNFEDESVNCIFIDAGHRHSNVIGQFKAWYSKIKVGGYFIFHDYVPKEIKESYLNDGVRKAVDEILLSGKIVKIECGGWCLVGRKI